MDLFLDTTDHLVIGLWDGTWKEWKEENSRSSRDVHFLIYECLENQGLSTEDIRNVFIVAGPGSYTGVRVGAGIGQIFKFMKINVYSFYHYQVPQYLGYEKGTWISKAFKGETFSYSWKGDEGQSELIPEENTHFGGPLFTHYPGKNTSKCEFTGILIKERGGELFSKVVQNNEQKSPFYYRPLEKEFNCRQ